MSTTKVEKSWGACEDGDALAENKEEGMTTN
jgi:hypothetical protein